MTLASGSIIGLALAISAAGAGPPQPLELFDPPQAPVIVLAPGQLLDLRFPAHYAGGMRWVASVEGNAIRYVGTAEVRNAQGGQVQQLIFKAETRGEAVIALAFRRPWDQSRPPREKRVYRVLVE